MLQSKGNKSYYNTTTDNQVFDIIYSNVFIMERFVYNDRTLSTSKQQQQHNIIMMNAWRSTEMLNLIRVWQCHVIFSDTTPTICAKTTCLFIMSHMTLTSQASTVYSLISEQL